MLSTSSSLSFGNVKVGTSAAKLLTLTNTGNSNLNISAVSASGSGFSTSGGSNMTLTPNQSTGVQVSFLPTAVGSADGTVNIATNDMSSVAQIAISGVGIMSEATTSSGSSASPDCAARASGERLKP